jgi:hypothetical protein
MSREGAPAFIAEVVEWDDIEVTVQCPDGSHVCYEKHEVVPASRPNPNKKKKGLS